MKAYAILAGGGVKGAALAGCLQAAEELHIDFVGYGGTSAGSIVALLAALGYSGHELLQMMVEEVDFAHFLDDGGQQLSRIGKLVRRLERTSSWRLPLALLGAWRREGKLWRQLREHLGLYRAAPLRRFLRGAISRKRPDLSDRFDITFQDLRSHGGKLLKVVASDVAGAKPVVFPDAVHLGSNSSVLDAIRASMSYPFVFEPVIVDGRYLVDGGLSSNLPVFLFDSEQQQDGLPVVAFDLVAQSKPFQPTEYGVVEYCRDLLTTAVESGDALLRQLTRRLYHVRVPIPSEIHALDFGVSKERRYELWRCGHSETHAFFRQTIPHWLAAQDEIERLQALYADPKLIHQVLEVFVHDLAQKTHARQLRAQIMLPTARGTRQVVYQYGMDGDPDNDLELAMDGGCTGRAWASRKPQVADLEKAQRDFVAWNLTAGQQAKVRRDRKAMLCVPMFDLGRASNTSHPSEMSVVGTLSLDSATRLADTGWLEDNFALRRAQFWADVFSQILSRGGM
jgi:NTE family protein